MVEGLDDHIHALELVQIPRDSLVQPFSDHYLQEITHNLQLKHFSKALELLQELCLNFPRTVEYPVKLGHLLYRQHKYMQAECYYVRALALDPHDLKEEIYLGLGQCYYRIRNYPASFSAFMNIEQTYPNSRFIDLVYLRLAMLYKIFRNYDSAMQLLLKLLRNNRVNKEILAEAFCCIGSIYQLQKNNELGVSYYINACKISKNFRVISCLIWGYLQVNPAFSVVLCKKYLQKPHEKYIISDIRLLQALALRNLGDFNGATIILEEQSLQFPMNIHYLQALGVIYYRMRLARKSFEKFQKTAAIEPCNVENLNNLGIIYRDLEMEKEFYQTYSLVLMLRKQNVEKEDFIPSTLRDLQIIEPVLDIFDFPLNNPN